MISPERLFQAPRLTGPAPTACLRGREAAQEILTTFLAWRPFGPSTTSKLTRSPSLRVLNPSALMEASWTKTSAPRSRTMKPNPLVSLNHFTVPCSGILLLLATNETGLLFLQPRKSELVARPQTRKKSPRQE